MAVAVAVIYQVDPRYTPGSAAQVTERQARAVALAEQDAYLTIIQNPDADHDAYVKARANGLEGIVEALVESRDGWNVEDLITGKRSTRPMRPATGRLLQRDLDALKALVTARGGDWVRKWTAAFEGQAAGPVIGRDPRD